VGEGDLSWEGFLAEGSTTSDVEVASATSGVAPRDPALIVYTSGSTGRPKGAVLPGSGLADCSRVQAERWPADPMRMLVNLPINHIGFIHGRHVRVNLLVSGGTAFFMERFDPVAILRLIETERLTGIGQVPTMFQWIVAQPEFAKADLSSLQRIVWGGRMPCFPCSRRSLERVPDSPRASG
jgi:fatty-acyl-CoA synthase